MTMIPRRKVVVGLAAFMIGVLAAMAPDARAQAWPTDRDRIRLVVPFNTAGSTDRMARAIASFLSYELNDVPVTVVNRPGSSGLIGSQWFLQQPDDGTYFLITHAVPYLSNSITAMNAPFKWSDFAFINAQWIQYQALIVKAGSKFASFESLIEAMRTPGAVSTAILHGSGGHLQTLIMLDKLGIPRSNLRYVTYEGGGPLRTSVAGGHTDFGLVSLEGTEGLKGVVAALAVFNQDPDDEWKAPTANSVLQAKYNITMASVGATYASLIAHGSFPTKHPDRYKTFVEGYKRMLDRKDFKEFAKKNEVGSEWLGPEKTKAVLDENFAVLSQYKDAFKN